MISLKMYVEDERLTFYLSKSWVILKKKGTLKTNMLCMSNINKKNGAIIKCQRHECTIKFTLNLFHAK